MDAKRFELAVRLKVEGNPKEAFQEFISLAQSSDDPLDKAAAVLYAASSLKTAGDFDLAKRQLHSIRPILGGAPTGRDTSINERRLWLEIAMGFEDADISRAEGRTQEAITKFEDLLSRFSGELRLPIFRPDYEMIQTRRAFSLADLGRWPLALPILIEAESYEQEKGSIYFYLGYCRVAESDYSRGEADLRKSLEIGLPPNLECRAHCALGKAYHKLEDYFRAKVELERCAQTADLPYIRQAKVWKWLELTCRHLGQKEEADHYAQLARPS